MATDLPIDGDGVCMACKKTPQSPESLTCCTCATPWHVPCLSSPPQTLASISYWLCPDCSPPPAAAGTATPRGGGPAAPIGGSGGLIAAMRAIEADGSLTEKEKARKRQELMSGGKGLGVENDEEKENGDEEKKKKMKKKGEDDVMELLDEKFKCSFCMQLPDRPVTTPCGHNFCLKCFQKWIGQGKRTCGKCRAPIPAKMASQPRINSALVVAIRMAKTPKPASQCGSTPAYHFIGNENRPETAFTTERAKKAGKANACSGQIFVTIAPDHFGPILAEHDPKRNKGVLVGESWEDRMECRQWGAHLPHVGGIAGQSTYGAQSVALSGGYEDDEDHGEWFLYTGSGGRDLSGNKRTNKDQSFDQKFENYNEALRVSCKKGYPVRVVRSHKEKRSSYAPETGVRYDGIYRIEKCWRKVGVQGFKVCRYLFVRCDNEPAPWTSSNGFKSQKKSPENISFTCSSDEHGDRPRPLPEIKELKKATDITVRKETPAWDYEEGYGWKWTKPPPPSRKLLAGENTGERKKGRKAKNAPSTMKEKLLKEFSCLICWKVMTLPLTTPCAHNFCKQCLVEAYDDQSFIRERTRGGRTLRAQKIVKKCPSCPNDISDFLQNPQVNRELMDLIESLQKKIEEENVEDSSEQESDVVEAAGEDGSDMEKAEEDGSDDVEKIESDAAEEELSNESNDKSGIVDGKVSEEGSDGHGIGEKLESVNGDSEVHAANSEMEEGGEGDCQSPAKKTDTQASHKRKQTANGKGASKKPRKSKEDSNGVEDMEDQQEDVQEKSTPNSVSPNRRGRKRKAPVQENGPSPLSPSTENRRLTRQMKLRGEL